jgi:hypothetical protein
MTGKEHPSRMHTMSPSFKVLGSTVDAGTASVPDALTGYIGAKLHWPEAPMPLLSTVSRLPDRQLLFHTSELYRKHQCI